MSENNNQTFVPSDEEKAMILKHREERATKGNLQARFDGIMAKNPGAWTPEETHFIGENIVSMLHL
jgi:hypothetical protein